MNKTTKKVWTAPALRKLGTISDVAGSRKTSADTGKGAKGYQNS